MNRFITTLIMMAMVLPALVTAQEAAKKEAAKVPETVQKADNGLQLDGGAEFRLRDEMKDHMPGTGLTEKKFENYVRVRSRVWGSAAYDDYTLYGRLANEFRVYTAKSGKKYDGMATYEFPDELFIDNLYFDAKNLLYDRVDLRVGRQEMKYGEGRIISDGSAADGSRATYFNAVKATLHVTEKTSLDAFGIYMPDTDDLAMGPDSRALETDNGYADNTDSGAGLYLTANEIREFPFELYYVWENQTHTHNIGKNKYGRDFSTFGTRLLPKFSEQISGEVELAVQTGETEDGRDIFGYMGYGGLTYVIAPDSSFKPYITPAILYLSGDDKPNSGDDNNWNPVFNRTTWFSVLLSDQYKNYAWANLIYPHLAGGVTVLKDQKLKIHTGPVFTVEDDQPANGTGDTYKGYLTFIRYEAPLLKGFFGKGSDLNHAIQLEVFEPGDYYTKDETAVFLRWEINAKF